MSFVNHYLSKYRLDKMSDQHKIKVSKLEKKLSEKINDSVDFDNDILVEYGPILADLVERSSNDVHDFSFSKFRVIINIGIEVYQIVEQMSNKIVPENTSPEKTKKIKIEFGKELVYFIWQTIDPLSKYLNWIPFKKTIEKKLVMWLSGYAIEASVDMFNVKEPVSVMSVNSIYKALP